MSSLFYRYATPFITGLFLVSLISGLALFFHIGPSGFHGMHEILSLVLIVPFVLHLWRNWRPMVSYFKRGPMIVALVVSTIAAGVFLLPSGDAGGTRAGPAPFRLANQVMQQPLAVVAPALGLTVEQATARLAAAGVTPGSGPLSEAATASGKSLMEVQTALLGSE